jgi:serine/threonine-protein kinase
MELSPGSAIGRAQRTIVELLQGNYAQALASAEATPAGVWRLIALAFATQRAGDPEAADRALKDLIDDSADGSAYQIAEVYALRGDAGQTFIWLDRAWTNRDPGLRRLLLDPFIAPYRGDPRFADFCRRIGLPLPKASGAAT